MRIIFLGAPGTGKGTQGKFIAEKYNIPKISTGDIIRENIYSKNKIGKMIKNIVAQGNLVPNEIVCNLINNRIQKNDCSKGFILDGFPRNIEQAFYLSHNKIKIDYVLELIMPYELILERISGRRIHLQSGRIYHIKFNPPHVKNIDDITGQPLIFREDDQKEIIRKRLKEYGNITNPLIQYYINENNIGNVKFFKINASDQLLKIKKQIESILKK